MVRRVSFSSDSRWLSVASDHGTTHVYALGDAVLGRSTAAATPHQHGSPFEAVAAFGLGGAATDADGGGDSIAMTAGAAFDPTVVHATESHLADGCVFGCMRSASFLIL